MASHNHYSRLLARVYDPVVHIPMRRIRKEVVTQVENAGAVSVIDMACGTGNQLLYLRDAGIREIKGIDVSDNMLAQARRNGLGSYCEKMDASATTFPDNTFDAAIMSFVLHETTTATAQGIFMEAKRIVKPHGKLIIVDYALDSKTKPLGSMGARMVEKMVGGEHYRNFKQYIDSKWLQKITAGMPLQVEKQFIFGAVRLWVYDNN